VVAAPAPALPRGGEHRRVVDQDVDPAQRLDRLGRQPLDGVRVGEVRLDDGMPVAREGTAYLVRGFLATQVVDDDPVAPRREGAGHRGPHAPGGAGDQDAAGGMGVHASILSPRSGARPEEETCHGPGPSA